MNIYQYENQCVVLNHVTYVKLENNYITFYIIGTEDTNHILFKYSSAHMASLEYNKIMELLKEIK